MTQTKHPPHIPAFKRVDTPSDAHHRSRYMPGTGHRQLVPVLLTKFIMKFIYLLKKRGVLDTVGVSHAFEQLFTAPVALFVSKR